MNYILRIFFVFLLCIGILESPSAENSIDLIVDNSDLLEWTHPDVFKWRFVEKKEEPKEEPVTTKAEKQPRLPMRPPTPFMWKSLPQKSVYFDYDKAVLKSEAKKAIVENINFLLKNPDYHVLIEGHCDERGTPEYNLALGQRRANAIKEYMVKLGIEEERITTKSWGEELPVDLGHNESAWRKNRRGDMYYSKR